MSASVLQSRSLVMPSNAARTIGTTIVSNRFNVTKSQPQNFLGINSNNPITKNLEALYGINTATNTLVDACGKYNADLFGGLSNTPTYLGMALNGQRGAYARSTKSYPGGVINQPMSAMAYVKRSANDTGIDCILSLGTSVADSAFALYINVVNAGDIYLGSNAADLYTSSGNVVPLNTWTHIAVVYPGGDFRNTSIIYVNGIAQSITTAGTGQNLTLASGYPVNIAGDSSPNTGREFRGQILTVGLWQRALTLAEIRSHRDNPWQLFAAPPIKQIWTPN